ncbi:MAG TPA: hypothetical protein VK673_11885 [Chthoniobacterales bacterium]|nr:hypothetical protein [Chthoniobacterales bacterium]
MNLESFQGLAVDLARDRKFVHGLEPADCFLRLGPGDTVDRAVVIAELSQRLLDGNND